MRPAKSRRDYYWILCRDPDSGKPHLIAGGTTEQEARQKGLEILGGIDFEVRGLPTRDLGRASAMVRGKRLEETHSLHKATERLGHDRSVNRMLKRRQSRRNRQPPVDHI